MIWYSYQYKTVPTFPDRIAYIMYTWYVFMHVFLVISLWAPTSARCCACHWRDREPMERPPGMRDHKAPVSETGLVTTTYSC